MAALAQTAALPLLGPWAAALSPFHGHVVVGATTREETAELLRSHDHFADHGLHHDHGHSPVASRSEHNAAAGLARGPRVVFVAGGGAGRLGSLLSMPAITTAGGELTALAAPHVREAQGAAWQCPASVVIAPMLPPPRAA